jgi:hypothetical protein
VPSRTSPGPWPLRYDAANMRSRRTGRVALLAVLTSTACGLAVYKFPSHRVALASAWLGIIGALVVYRLVAAVWDANPSPPLRAWRSRMPARLARWVVRARARARPNRPRSAIPAELARVEGLVIDSLTTASGVHRRLRPLARDIAADRLGLLRGLRIEAGGDAIRAAAGDRLWELIRPDRPMPANGFAPGFTIDELEAVVSALEKLN